MQTNTLTLNAIFQTKIHVVNSNMVTGRKHKAGSCPSPTVHHSNFCFPNLSAFKQNKHEINAKYLKEKLNITQHITEGKQNV